MFTSIRYSQITLTENNKLQFHPLHLIGVKLGSAINNTGEYINQRECLENRAQCEAVICTLGGQTTATATGWTRKIKNAYKTMLMEDLRVDDRILKCTLIKVLWTTPIGTGRDSVALRQGRSVICT
jgi:hypothetical protein